MSSEAESGLPVCSWCGKGQHEVRKLIAGPGVCICDECVELCADIVAEATGSRDKRRILNKSPAGDSPEACSRYPKEIYLIQTERRGHVTWHGAFSTKWKAIECMNRIGIAGDYLLGRGVSIVAFPLDRSDETDGPSASFLFGRFGRFLANLLASTVGAVCYLRSLDAQYRR
ncbi:MAG: hypothetical protein HYY13_00685 [Nitrospirae bacterium]|nr:hypothetical protein [Nitrospirota bacterium]